MFETENFFFFCYSTALCDLGSIPGSGRSLGGGHGNPLRMVAQRIPWTEKPGGLQSMELQRVRHN